LDWIDDLGPDPIPPDLLDRIMYLGTPTTLPDGSHVQVIPEGPQAHLAIQGSATRELTAHFHGVEQFQLFVRGAGTVGRHAMHAGLVHYSDRFTVYGPLRAGPEGMAYATLRGRHDSGAHFMPDSRAALADFLSTSARSAKDRRNVTVDLCAHDDESSASGWRDLLADPDGFRVAVHQVERSRPTTPLTVSGAGAYVAVVAGAIADEGTTRGPGAVSWHEPGSSFQVVATETGARIALLQFPAVAAAT
jgi:hypothetical protein